MVTISWVIVMRNGENNDQNWADHDNSSNNFGIYDGLTILF